MIKVDNVQCQALHFSHQFETGKHHIIAPNGGGKTTLFKLLTAQLKPEVGRICINGLNPAEKSYKQQFGFCPDQLNFWPFATVADYMAIHLKAYGLKSLNTDAQYLANQFALPSLKIEQLSLGQAKQLMILCCVTSPANWLFFDEPLNGLDAQSKEAFTHWLDQTQKSVLISSHIDLPRFNKVTLRGSDELRSASA